MFYKQLTLPGFEFNLSLSPVRFGFQGEQMVYESLSRAGHEVVYTRRGECGDLKVLDRETGEIVRIEVKISRRAIDGKWRFTLYKRKSQSHFGVDVVILLVVPEWGVPVPFVLPKEVVLNQHQAVITSHPLTYKGKLSPYRQSLDGIVLC